MVNFVSIYCPELQRLLKPIYDLTRKGRQFIWGEEQQKAFDEIKQRLQRPPVLHLPNRQGQFQLYSDTSKFATGSTLPNSEWTAKAHCLCKQGNARGSLELLYYRTRDVWTSNEYCDIFAPSKES